MLNQSALLQINRPLAVVNPALRGPIFRRTQPSVSHQRDKFQTSGVNRAPQHPSPWKTIPDGIVIHGHEDASCIEMGSLEQDHMRCYRRLVIIRDRDNQVELNWDRLVKTIKPRLTKQVPPLCNFSKQSDIAWRITNRPAIMIILPCLDQEHRFNSTWPKLCLSWPQIQQLTFKATQKWCRNRHQSRCRRVWVIPVFETNGIKI